MQGYGYQSVEIVKLIMQETGTYNQQWRRSFESSLDGRLQNAIIENCQQAGSITPGLLTGIANQFIKPSATPERPINIINGWNTRRFRFFMEVRSMSHMQMGMTQYVTGFTDHMGASLQGSLDPNMVFYINTVNTTRNSVRTTPLGKQNVQSVMDCSHLLYNNENQGVYGTGTVHKMRPEEVFAAMQNTELQDASGDVYGPQGDFMDTRTHLTANPVKSTRRFNSSPVFMAGILNSYVQSKRADVAGTSNLELLDTASGQIAAARTNEDPFIRLLKSQTGSNGGTFTFGDLLRIDANIQQRIVVSPLTPALRATLHQAGQTQNWQSSDFETQFATTLSQAVPGYMLDNCLQYVKIRATNEDGGGEIVVFITNYGSLLQGIDPAPYLASFSFAVQNTLLKDLSYNNQISFSLEMSCNLLGDTSITLSINGSPPTPYVSPCFCDSLMSPLVTADFGKLNTLAKDMSLVVDYLGDATVSGAKFETNNDSYI
jgi:hypothetical protein